MKAILLTLGLTALTTSVGFADLVVHYKLDESPGATQAADASGNGYTGTITNATFAAGQAGAGNALSCDGTSDYVENTSIASALNGLSEVTVALWVKSDVTNTDKGFLSGANPDGTDGPFAMRYDLSGADTGRSQVIKIGISTTSGTVSQESSASVQTTSWQHVAMTWKSGESLKLYIDGVLDQENTTTIRTGSLSSIQKIMLGRGAKDTGTASWDGLIDDFRIYDEALGQSAIAQLMILGPPTAAYTYTPASGDAPFTTNFDASTSSDPNGTITDFDWDFGDTSTGTGSSIQHTFTNPGFYTVTLTVTDNDGNMDSTEQIVKSGTPGPNQLPTASISKSTSYGFTPLAVQFDGQGSSDSDGLITAYAWDFGDGSMGTGATASHTYSAPGTYAVSLTVTDDEAGVSDPAVTVVDVMGSPIYPFLEESSQVVFNAINYSQNNYRTGNGYWYETSGDESNGMQAHVNTNVTPSWATSGELVYQIMIQTAGSYQIAMRRSSGSSSSDEVWVGVDGQQRATVSGNTNWDYKWSSPVSLGSLSAGVHTIELRYKDNGLYVDRIMISSVGGFPTSGSTDIGPVESARNGANLPPTATISHNAPGGVLSLPAMLEFEAENASDSDGQIISYDWRFSSWNRYRPAFFKEGSTVDHQIENTISDSPGTLSSDKVKVTLTLTDDQGGVTEITEDIQVENKLDTIPWNGSAVIVNDGNAFGNPHGDVSNFGFTNVFYLTSSGDVIMDDFADFAWEYGNNYRTFRHDLNTQLENRYFQFEPVLPSTGDYAVQLYWPTTYASLETYLLASKIPVEITEADTSVTTVYINQQPEGTLWKTIGIFNFDDVQEAKVRIKNQGAEGYVLADAVRYIPLGNPGGSTNQNPVAAISPSVTQGPAALAVVFSAASSTDADGTVEYHFWNFGDGYTAVGPETTHVFKETGSYTVKLTVIDDAGGLDSAATTITVNAGSTNEAPVARASVSEPASNSPALLTFDATSSTDDGTINSYRWEFTQVLQEGKPVVYWAESNGSSVQRVFVEPGMYQYRLTVTDDRHVQSQTTGVFEVREPGLGTGPETIADNGVWNGSEYDFEIAVPVTGRYQIFLYTDYGSAYFNNDDPMMQIQVSQGALDETVLYNSYIIDQSASQEWLIGVFNLSQDSPVHLAVETIQLAYPSIRLVQVGDTSEVDFLLTPSSGQAPLLVNFDASASSSGTPIIDYAWNFGDGATGSGVTPSHTYTAAGFYPIRLTITDAEGLTSSTLKTLTVTEAPGSLTADIEASVTSGTAPLSVTFDATGSMSSASPIFSYHWDFGDGRQGSGSVVSHRYTKDDSYQVVLTVKNGDGDEATAQQAITTTPALSIDQPEITAGNLSLDVGVLTKFTNSGATGGATVNWEFGDGNDSSDPTAYHAYVAEGEFVASIEVAGKQASLDVHVSQPALGSGANFLLDEGDTDVASITGSWTAGSSDAGFLAADYLHDNDEGKGAKQIVFTPNLADADDYAVFIRWPTTPNAATNVPVTVTHAGGSDTITVDQLSYSDQWVYLGTFSMASGSSSSVTVSNADTDGYTVVDGVLLTKLHP